MATKAAASWAVNLKYSDLPPEVISTAVQSFYNWVGCTIGGSNHAAVKIAYDALSPFFGASSTSKLLGTDKLIDAQHAALINGIASHVDDYDDTHLESAIHPTGPVVSALLAICEQKGGIGGKEFILAQVAGVEVACKVGLSVLRQHYDVGWHITSTTGSIGAAVAVGKVLGLSVPAMQHAIGIAATQVTGLREMFGSHTKSFHPGRAAQNGLMAALLAAQGYTSSLQALEAQRGWANVVSTTVSLEKWIPTLGKEWEMLKNAFKPFPCGVVIHPIIDGCIQLKEETGLGSRKSLGDIERVDLKVHPLVLELTGKTTPRDSLEAKFSVFHGAAIGLVYGAGTPSQYEDEIVQNSTTSQMRDKVRAAVDDSMNLDGCSVTILWKDGTKTYKHVEHCVGSLDVPMTNEQLEAKFLDQTAKVIGERATVASKACWGLETVEDMRDLAQIL
ncbi:hypothetical protein CLAIMM_00084 [Cladophialophora immunda]|nr:hypothetical protein CLAIMM_00084 [Cladophialophora immunda]